MKPLTKFYIKIVLYFAITFGVMCILINSALGVNANLIIILVLSILGGIAEALLLVPAHLKELKKLGIKEFTDADFAPTQKREIAISISKDEIFQKIKNDPHLNEMALKADENTFVLKSKISSKSYGEVIKLKLQELGNDVSQVFISSRSKWRGTLLDHGINRQNVDYIENTLKNS